MSQYIQTICFLSYSNLKKQSCCIIKIRLFGPLNIPKIKVKYICSHSQKYSSGPPLRWSGTSWCTKVISEKWVG